MYQIIIDGILLLIFALCTFNGIKRGLIKSFFGFFITFASFILAGLMAEFFSSVTYTLFFEKTVQSTISQFILNENFSNISNLNFSGTFAPFLNFIKKCIEKNSYYTINSNNIKKLFEVFIIKILKIIMTTIFYMIIKAIFTIILKTTETQPIRILDSVLGGGFGALKGLLLIIITVILTDLLLPILSYEILSQQVINSTVIFNQINEKIILNKNLPTYEIFQKILSIKL